MATLNKITSTLAKTEDGTVQVTFSIPNLVMAEHEAHVLEELKGDITVPGFRKGMAPVDKVRNQISKDKLAEKTLTHILPHAFADAVEEHKLHPATYPKFEVVGSEPNWQIRATTCEIIPFELGDYHTLAKNALKDAKKETREEKEQKVLQVLIDSIKLTIPKILIEEEVNMRLSHLLDRIEKLGLTLDGYLASIGKDVNKIREEYTLQTVSAISLELILNKIAEEEKIKVSAEAIDEAIKGASADPEFAKKGNAPEQRRVIESILRRRSVLDSLIA